MTLQITLPAARDRLVGNSERLRVLAALDGTTEVSARDLQNLILAGEALQRRVEAMTAPKPPQPYWKQLMAWAWDVTTIILAGIGAYVLAFIVSGGFA